MAQTSAERDVEDKVLWFKELGRGTRRRGPVPDWLPEGGGIDRAGVLSDDRWNVGPREEPNPNFY